MGKPIVFVAATLLWCQSAVALQLGAQQSNKAILIRTLGPVTAASKDTLGARIITRGLPNGSVLVGVFPFGDDNRRRVKLFDSTLQHVTLVMDSTKIPQLIRYRGDSTLALDESSRTLLVLDPRGEVARVIALPKQQDFYALTGFIHTPWIDPTGKLIYQGWTPRPPPDPAAPPTSYPVPFNPDSAPIVRADFDTRRLDTVATIKIATPQTLSMTQDNQNITQHWVWDPMAVGDEWAMLSDGTIAIVRSQDYHIDWVDPDGTRRSTPKMPFDWKRLTDAEKQAKLDSLKPALDTARASNPPETRQGPVGPFKFSREFEPLARGKLPDYEPPIGPGSVRADLDGNLWIVPRTSAAAKGGLLYDVVNRKGEIVERVQFPKGVALVGFGPGGVVYLNTVEGNNGFLSVAKIR
jgi:hypothetical protein